MEELFYYNLSKDTIVFTDTLTQKKPYIASIPRPRTDQRSLRYR
jgi:hypothetical protein